MDTTTRLRAMTFADLYECYRAKILRKDRTIDELDAVLTWYFNDSPDVLTHARDSGITLGELLDTAQTTPHAPEIRGVVCGVRVEDISDPFLRAVRQLDKIVDELARGKKVAAILRG